MTPTSADEGTFTLQRRAWLVLVWTVLGMTVTAAGGAATVLYRVDQLEVDSSRLDTLINARIKHNEVRWETLNRSTTRVETKVEDLDRRSVRIEDKLDRLLMAR